ncbi:glycosyltransferase family 2 protein [Rhodosalinus sp.]|uniref:glycosyltransferase family 2 protein n=1 Tax=Rhodosalinus sp. TaxID=2047741 RepID=UPI00397B7966
MEEPRELWLAYRLRWKRRRLLFRALRKRRQLRPVATRTATIRPGAILAFATVRNEALRLPFFLDHHRRLGVDHFLIVDNDSDDGTREWLADQPDVSLWRTGHSYKLSRFGMDWLTWLQIRHGHGHWCLTLDADEILIYPHHDTRPLPALTEWLAREGRESLGALMLDMYPKGPPGAQPYAAGADPFETLAWFDAGNYFIERQPKLRNLWIRGGVRARMFFADRPRRAPTLNKVPLVRWNRRYVYNTSTHQILPRRLNAVYAEDGGELLSGVLLHTKFLNTIVEKSAEEKERGEHFEVADNYRAYYDSLLDDPDLWCAASTRFTGWRQLVALGLMSRGDWV